MKFDKILYFLTETSEINRLGNTITINKKRKVFCSEKSIGQKEFYTAQMAGLEPKYTLVVKPYEYLGEKLVEFNSIQFKILKTYMKNSTELELTLESVKVNV